MILNIQGHVEVMCKVTTDATIELSSDDETGNYLPKLPSPDPVILCPNWENERPPLALVRVDSVVPFHPVVSYCNAVPESTVFSFYFGVK